MNEMAEKLQMEEEGGKHPWYEVVTGPRMGYRTALGMVIQALQQLTGANYFFYYGTTIFTSIGLSNSYVTQIILGMHLDLSLHEVCKVAYTNDSRCRQRGNDVPRFILY